MILRYFVSKTTLFQYFLRNFKKIFFLITKIINVKIADNENYSTIFAPIDLWSEADWEKTN